jgi:hypothetical protein
LHTFLAFWHAKCGEMMEENGYKIIRKLISDVEGAPFPNAINNELYTIWYEHMQIIAQEALEFLDLNDTEPQDEIDSSGIG